MWQAKACAVYVQLVVFGLAKNAILIGNEFWHFGKIISLAYTFISCI
jgi:hypothetical protein